MKGEDGDNEVGEACSSSLGGTSGVLDIGEFCSSGLDIGKPSSSGLNIGDSCSSFIIGELSSVDEFVIIPNGEGLVDNDGAWLTSVESAELVLLTESALVWVGDDNEEVSSIIIIKELIID